MKSFLESPILDIPCPQWIISDTHIGHAPMLSWYPWRHQTLGLPAPAINAAGRPVVDGVTMEKHDRAIVEAWRAVVKPQDCILHCGDAVMGRGTAGKVLHKLRGKVYVVKGNHDTTAELAGWAVGVAMAVRFNLPDGRRVLARHAPASFLASEAAEYDTLLHGHVHGRSIAEPMEGERPVEQAVIAKAIDCSMDRWKRWGPIALSEVVS